MSTLRYYEKSGLFNNVNRIGGTRDYNDEDIHRLSLIVTLKKAGFTLSAISNYLSLQLYEEKTKKERIQLLEKERSRLLKQVHDGQKNIDSIDYLIYTIQKEQ